MLSLTDSHCHLDFNTFDVDREAVISRARDAGVLRLVNPGIDLQSSRAALQIADTHEDVYVACGVHPNDALTWKRDTVNELRKLVKHPKVVAIGEIGLDYYRDRAPRDLQKHVLNEQLALAAEVGLPVLIHNRQATDDILELLASWHSDLVSSGSPLTERAGVLHSFSGDGLAASKAIELNFMLGISGPITYRNAEDLRRVVAGLPLSALLIETDAPFLTPHPHRGERNEPAHVRWVAEKIAEIHDLPLQVVADQTNVNSQKLFSW